MCIYIFTGLEDIRSEATCKQPDGQCKSCKGRPLPKGSGADKMRQHLDGESFGIPSAEAITREVQRVHRKDVLSRPSGKTLPVWLIKR